MAEKAKIGDVVELVDQTAGFTDAVTGFDLSRGQQKELTEPIGERTQAAILSGRLLIVETKPAKGKTNEPNAGAAGEPETNGEETDAADAKGKKSGKGK